MKALLNKVNKLIEKIKSDLYNEAGHLSFFHKKTFRLDDQYAPGDNFPNVFLVRDYNGK